MRQGCFYFPSYAAACQYHGELHGFKARKTVGYVWNGAAHAGAPFTKTGQTVIELPDGRLDLSPEMHRPNRGLLSTMERRGAEICCTLPIVKHCIHEGWDGLPVREEAATVVSLKPDNRPALFRWLDQQTGG